MKSKFATLLLLMFAATAAWGGNHIQGDWGWSDAADDYYYAVTSNEAEHLLGQYCYFESGECLYLVTFNTTCEKGAETPAVINSDLGSIAVTLHCGHVYDGSNVLFISEFKDIDSLIRGAKRIGMAVPMLNDQFRVSRWSLEGSTAMIDQMRKAAEARFARKKLLKRGGPAQEDL